MYNKCKAILIASNQEQNSLYGYKDKSLLFGYNKEGYNKLEAEKEFTQHYHLYIISEDEIKENEFDNLLKQGLYFESSNEIIKVITNQRIKTIGTYKKIIATTDNELGFGDEFGYFEHLPQIPQSFIEQYITEYNKGNIISDVLVEYEKGKMEEINKGFVFPSILKINQNNTINIKTVKDSFSREEVTALITKAISETNASNNRNVSMLPSKFIEQNL